MIWPRSESRTTTAPRALPAIFRIFFETPLERTIKGCGAISPTDGAGRSITAAMTVAALLPSDAGQHFIEDAAEREDIGTRVDLSAIQLLGRHVVQGSRDGPSAVTVRAWDKNDHGREGMPRNRYLPGPLIPRSRLRSYKYQNPD